MTHFRRSSKKEATKNKTERSVILPKQLAVSVELTSFTLITTTAIFIMSSSTINRCYRLRSHPVGKISSTDLELVEEDIPTIEDGQVLVKTLYASIDPTHRIWMAGKKAQYMDPVELGDVMRAATVGVVTESQNADYPVGMKVMGFGGLCDYHVGIPGVNVYYPAACNEDPSVSPTVDLSYASIIIGLTAWHGVNKILEPTLEDIVVVSGAAGAVGSLVGQLSKLKGATVIGIAGGPTKCAYLTETLGFDYAIDYKSESVEERLKEIAPDGITRYFDNVGGDVSDAVFENARNFSKFAICGSISEYDDNWTGIKNFNMILMRRITVQGFICVDHMDELGEAKGDLLQFVKEGKISFKEDVREGLENYVDVVNLLFSGGNAGKLILKINDE